MKNTTPCFVYGGDQRQRQAICSQLEQIGYYICPCALFAGSDYLSASFVERNTPNQSGYEVHGIPAEDDGTGYSIELVRWENLKAGDSVDCGDNVEFFLALCGVRTGVLRLYNTRQIIDHFSKNSTNNEI